MNDPNPYSTPQGEPPVPKSLARIAGAGVAGAIPLILVFLCCGGLWLYSRHELLAEFSLSRGTVRIYAEGEVHYEPPGYIYFELLEGGQITIPERRFMGIGIERVPAERFGVIESHDGDVFAIVLENDIKMMHQFSSNSTWPGVYTDVDDEKYQLGEHLLAELRKTHEHASCARQDNFLARRAIEK